MTAHAPAVDIFAESAGPIADSSATIEGRPLSAWRAEARQALGLPDAPIFAAGHQAQSWHPGIVAKTFWTDARAKQHGAIAVHVVVDQDAFDGCFVEWPELKDGFWTAKGQRFAPASPPISALRVPAFLPRDIADCSDAPDFVRDGLRRLTELLKDFQASPNAALQVSLLAQLKAFEGLIDAPRVVSASQLTATSFARHLIDRMLKDPAACAGSFNEALTLHPRAARPLQVDGERSELPLWLLDETVARIRATAGLVRAARSSGHPMLPRAFLLGVLARTALAERFTHGIGGRMYEEVSNEWTQRWLGWRAPAFDVVSATLRLPLDIKEIEPALSYRTAWSDPDLATVPGAGPSLRRKEFLETIAQLPRRSPQRRRLYEDMIADRRARRGALAEPLERLKASAESQRRSTQSKELALRRTWCALLHPLEAVVRLRDQLLARLVDTA